MYVYITLVVLPVVLNFVTCQSTTLPSKEAQQKPTLKSSSKETENPLKINTILKSIGDGHTISKQPRPPAASAAEINPYRFNRIFIAPSHLTKLAKTLSLGFDPSFRKEHFEPFERRPRPVTLVSFRKNGLEPRLSFKTCPYSCSLGLDWIQLIRQPLIHSNRDLFLCANVSSPENNIVSEKLDESLEVAELQSPFNDVGHFWQDVPGDY